MNEEITVGGRRFTKVIDAANIGLRIAEIGKAIDRDYAGKNPLLLGILNGAFVFMADLARQISVPVEVTFARFSSYEGLQNTGKLRTVMELKEEITGRDVILVEDIIDSGLTMQKMLVMCAEKNPASLRIASLILKPEALQVNNLSPYYVGFEMPNDFLVGYGLDYDGYGRNLPHIYQLKV